MNRTHQQSISASCFCISQEVTAGKSRIGQKIHVQPETLGAWSSPGPSARASCSGFPEAGLRAESHGEGSQPGLGPPQPRGQWVSRPVQHRPCKRTRLSSSTDSLGQGTGSDPSTDHCEVCHCVLMGVGLVKPGTSLFLTLKAAWVCVPHIALCGRRP